MEQPQFSTGAERWEEISEFPGYFISDHGHARNKIGKILSATKNTRGIWIVGLMKDGVQCKRSIAVLVADAFVPKPSNTAFDTPIHLNGDQAHNHHSNLTWRPLWFARKYKKQFIDDHQTFIDPIEDVETGIVYDSSWNAATYHGLLDQEIFNSMLQNTYVWPTGQVFREAINR